MVQQETNERNLALERGNARLEVNVDKLRYQLQQKNIHEANLKSLKLENELLKSRNTKTSGNEKTKLDNEKLKETIKSIKTLHRDQIRMKDARISKLNSTIKSLKTIVNGLEKSLDRLQFKFMNFQRQSATNITKLQHKKELIEIKDQKKRERESMDKKKEEMNHEKEITRGY